MLLRTIIFSVFLFFVSSGFAASPGFAAVNKTQSVKEKDINTRYSDDEIIVYKWIDGVRWAFVYSQDGAFLDYYPDPED